MERIPVRNEEFVWRKLEEELVLLNPQDGKYYGMNAVGCSFWEKIDGSRTIRDIIELLFDEYEIGHETLEQDIDELVTNLEKNNIITLRE